MTWRQVDLQRSRQQARSPSFLLVLLLLQLLVGANLYRGAAPRSWRQIQPADLYDPRHDLKVGKPVPPLQGETGEGKAVDIPRQAAGKPTVIVFASSCGACNEQGVQPLQRLQRRAALWVLMPSVPPHVKEFYVQHRLAAALLREGDSQAAVRYNAAWRPRLFLVDGQGRLRYAQSPRETLQRAIERVERLLNHRGGKEDERNGKTKS